MYIQHLHHSVHWNIKTNLLHQLKSTAFDVICIQEHPVHHEDREEIRDRSMGEICTNVSKNLTREAIFPELLHNKRTKRRPGKTFIKQLEEDITMGSCDIIKLMEDRINWKRFAMLTWVHP